MFTQIAIGVLVILAALAAGGCGVQIGTPDYWREYNESVRGARENISNADRAKLGGIIERIGK